MGSTNWSDSHYAERKLFRAKTGKDAFAYHDDVVKGRTAAKVNDKMNPSGVKFREARDSDAHPQSRAVAVLFDVTGSMQSVPRLLQESLPKLMGLLIRKGYLEHPAIMVGGIGDATCDQAPLQVGQFEAGIEIEDDLAKMYLEGGGGGHITESYELAMYFMARHTALDCYEKRGQKGYLFFIGDETPYDAVKKSHVKAVLGESIQEDIPVENLIKELQERYEVYYILPKMTTNYDRKEVHQKWVKLLGQNVFRLEEPDGICEMIAGIIGVAEGKVDPDGVRSDLEEFHTTAKVTRAVTSALVPFGASATAARGTALGVPDSGAPSGVTKL